MAEAIILRNSTTQGIRDKLENVQRNSPSGFYCRMTQEHEGPTCSDRDKRSLYIIGTVGLYDYGHASKV